MLLTDEEIMAAGYNSGDPDGVLEFGKNVIAEYEAKLREQKPDQTMIECVSGSISKHISTDLYQREVIAAAQYIVHRYCNPAPIPEGYALVPIEPPDSMLVYVVGFSSQFANTNQFSDTRINNYKAMLNAAKDTNDKG